jgi:hypothetical protein
LTRQSWLLAYPPIGAAVSWSPITMLARPDQVDLGAGITGIRSCFRCASKNATILRLASCADGW